MSGIIIIVSEGTVAVTDDIFVPEVGVGGEPEVVSGGKLMCDEGLLLFLLQRK